MLGSKNEPVNVDRRARRLMSWERIAAQPCSVARSLGILGDRWTLLIIRNLFLRMRRFDALQADLKIPRRVLSLRLSRLVDAGVLERVPYQTKPVRHEYRLTAMGRDMYPIILAFVAWGDRWLDGSRGAPVTFRHRSCGQAFAPTMCCSECGAVIDARDVVPEAGPGMVAAGE
jgi:DNA-binding HxlR family transcriptional regulator